MKTKNIWIYIVRYFFLGIFLLILSKAKPILWLGIFGISLVAAFVFGRVYCGWICPMNTLMNLVGFVTKKLNIKRRKSPKLIVNGWLAIVLLIVSVLVMVIVKRMTGVNIPVLPFFLVLSVLITFVYEPYVFHNKICPFGVLQRATGKFAFFSRGVDKNKCIGCKLCEKVCPAEAVTVSLESQKAAINSELCHQCFECEIVCPKNAISYGHSRQR